jgi:nitroreductase
VPTLPIRTVAASGRSLLPIVRRARKEDRDRNAAGAHSGRRVMDVYEALYTTRMMRRMKRDPVPMESQCRILDAAIRAPNGGNAQRWHFLVVDDPPLKARTAELYSASRRRSSEADVVATEMMPPVETILAAVERLPGVTLQIDDDARACSEALAAIRGRVNVARLIWQIRVASP